MSIKKLTLIIMAGMSMLPLYVQSQTCSELFQSANNQKDNGNYEAAIANYKKARNCDPYLKSDCNRWIKYCEDMLKNSLAVSEETIIIPYQGGDKEINVKSGKSWNVECVSDWLNTNAYDNKNFIIECREPNNSLREKTATIMVKSGNQYKTLNVIQEGRPEYLEVSAQNVNFPASGSEDIISIESNAKWSVSSKPSWCKIIEAEDGIHIVVSPNDKVIGRADEIVVVSPSKSVKIRVQQGAGEEHLTLSQNNLVLSQEGGTYYLKVYTDADNWFVGDYPTWMNVQKLGSDSLCIFCAQNIPNGQPRSGSVQVKTNQQTAGVMATQLPRLHTDVIFPEGNIVGGRNFSLGISASYYMPTILTSAGGDYIGSVVDYGMGTSAENANYKSATGFSVGLFADMRIFKNVFLIAGVNFSQIKYKNDFNKKTILTTDFKPHQYMQGEVQNSYTEDYSYKMIEVPIMASYRFKLSDMSHVQLNFGPVINLGLSAKMKFAGSTDGETMHIYDSATTRPIDTSNYLHHTASTADFNLYQPCVLWDMVYTQGNDANVTNHDEFSSAPIKRINCGLRIGAAYEWAGISFGLYYTYMITNMANKGYWENERWTVLNNSQQTMKGYSMRINTLEFKLAYTLRY